MLENIPGQSPFTFSHSLAFIQISRDFTGGPP